MASQMLVLKIQMSIKNHNGSVANCLLSSKTSYFNIFRPYNQHICDQFGNIEFMMKIWQPTAQKLAQRLSHTGFISTKSLRVESTRRSIDFEPSIWADYFLSHQQVIDATMQHEHEKLKEEVRRMVIGLYDSPALQPKLILIDTLQRLGIFYHFETEIGGILRSIHQHHVYDGDDSYNDLLSTALLFRLLRQDEIYVSPDIFKKFQDNEGYFNECLIHDVCGILALYEASFLGMHGEVILDEAQAFTITHLKSTIAMDTCPPELSEQVNHALDVPLHWNFGRLEARHYILVYKQKMSEAHEEALLKFAALDFNIVQALHHNEISQITQWWNQLNTIKTPRFISRVVEYFFMTLMVYFEPDYSEARMLAVKLIHLITPIDNAYDNYGTTKELELFMDAIERLDLDYIDMLPEYMKSIFNNLLNFLREVEQRTKEQPYIMFHIKKELKRLVRGFLDEAKWSNEEHEPTVEEYMKVAIITVGGIMLPVIYFTGMGVLATEEAFQWVASLPRIVEATATISRIMDDLAPSKVEALHLPTAVKCYIKQYGVSKKQAKSMLMNQVKNAWKDINEELIREIGVTKPKPILMRILNCARAGYIFGRIGDMLENPEIAKPIISSLFIDPIIV